MQFGKSKRTLWFALQASDYISGTSVIVNIRRNNLVAYLNTVKPDSSRLAFITLCIYYTSKRHDSCPMNQEILNYGEKNINTHVLRKATVQVLRN